MKKLLRLLQKKEDSLGVREGLISVRIFADGSGWVLTEADEEIFDFDNIEDLLTELKKGES